LTPRVVSNASPLIYAARIGFLGALEKLYGKILIPQSVYSEVVEKGAEKKAADALVIEEAVERGFLQVADLDERARVESEVLAKTQNISTGEAEATALAKQVRAELLIIDERGDTTAARALGIRTVGLLGVIIEAMYRGIITFEELRTYYNRLTKTEFRLKHRDHVKAMELAEKVREKVEGKTIPRIQRLRLQNS